MSDTVIRVENISKLYRLGEVGTGSLAHDVNRWWHRVRGKEDPYLKIGEVNDRTRSAKQARTEETTNHTNKHEKLTTEDTESTTEHRGRCEMEKSQIGPKRGSERDRVKGSCGRALGRPSWRCLFKSLHKRACAGFRKNIAYSLCECPTLFGRTI